MREALGFEQLNLWGGSYGTRVALHYLRKYPERTRSVIIDGVVPGDLLLGPSMATDAQASLDLLFDRCAESADCSAARAGAPILFPDAEPGQHVSHTPGRRAVSRPTPSSSS